MTKTSKKYRNFLQFTVKISVIIAAFYFIYYRLFFNENLDINTLNKQVINAVFKNHNSIIILLVLTALNWFMEILKWQILVSNIQKINLIEATEQTLAAHTGALLTPNRIGEYGIKAIYFDKKNQKKIMLLNLIHHMLQMTVTVMFGIVGTIYLIKNYNIELPKIKYQKIIYYTTGIILIFIMGNTVIHKKIRTFYWNKIVHFLKNTPKKILFTGFILSVLKYFIFVHQFIYLAYLFEVKINYTEFLLLLFAFYLLASVLPSIPIFDWIIKGSVAIMILQFAGVNEITATIITTIMWFLNFAVPAILGSYFILKFKKQPYLYQKSKI